MEKGKDHFLSVVIPAFKQEKTIVRDVSRIRDVLEQIRYDYEIIIVVDGFVDETYKRAQKLKSDKIKVVGYETNKGKGHAVRYGMVRTKGDLVAFIDAGMEIDPNGLSMILEHMQWYNADVIVGSKRHPASQVNYPPSRKIISFFYQFFVRVFTGLNVRDTQVGLKIYRREVLEKVLPRLLVKTYAFDLEILSVAHHLGFKRIFEAPIKLKYNFSDLTHAATLTHMRKAFIESLAIIYRLKLRRYYDDDNKRKWRYDPDLNFKVNLG